LRKVVKTKQLKVPLFSQPFANPCPLRTAKRVRLRACIGNPALSSGILIRCATADILAGQ